MRTVWLAASLWIGLAPVAGPVFMPTPPGPRQGLTGTIESVAQGSV